MPHSAINDSFLPKINETSNFKHFVRIQEFYQPGRRRSGS